MKVKDVIAAIKAQCPPIDESRTCDILHVGNWEAEVHKIACVFMADIETIRKAAAEGVDLIITHEPTYHTGADNQEWLAGNPVYEEKQKLIREAGISIWRFHDHMHAYSPDLIYVGWDKEMGWENCRLPGDRFGVCYEIPETTLGGLADFFKEKLSMPAIRLIGDPDMPCKRVSVLVGGGSLGLGDERRPAMQMVEKDIDVMVCGEITEWTSCSYVRDAAMLGKRKGMIVLGHNRTEEAGMKYLPDWLQPLVGDIPVCFISSGDPFIYR